MATDLPPTLYLIMEVLASRHRTGEHLWSFPSELRRPLDGLLRAGLIDVLSSPAPGALRGTAHRRRSQARPEARLRTAGRRDLRHRLRPDRRAP